MVELPSIPTKEFFMIKSDREGVYLIDISELPRPDPPFVA